MHYRDDNFSPPWHTPETVILQHGNAKNSKLWYEWVPLLARNCRVIRVDARGFGRSSVPEPGGAMSAANLAADLAHLMDALEIAKAHVIGETFGTTIALELARLFADRVQSLCLCSCEYRGRGEQKYSDMREQVRTEGVEAWARRQGARYNRPEWYIHEMSQTHEQVLMACAGAGWRGRIQRGE